MTPALVLAATDRDDFDRFVIETAADAAVARTRWRGEILAYEVAHGGGPPAPAVRTVLKPAPHRRFREGVAVHRRDTPGRFEHVQTRGVLADPLLNRRST